MGQTKRSYNQLTRKIPCWKCEYEATKPMDLQHHLNTDHPGWAQEAIKKMGLHVVQAS